MTSPRTEAPSEMQAESRLRLMEELLRKIDDNWPLHGIAPELRKQINAALAQPADAKPEQGEVAWLIESPEGRWGRGYFWKGGELHSYDSFGTIDTAIRLSRKEDAEAMIEQLQRGYRRWKGKSYPLKLEACEHEWVSAAPQEKPHDLRQLLAAHPTPCQRGDIN
jgi:hypothetical protein